MNEEQLDKIRAILKEKLPGQGYILLVGSPNKDSGTHIVSNVCKDHFIQIMTGILKGAEEQGYKDG